MQSRRMTVDIACRCFDSAASIKKRYFPQLKRASMILDAAQSHQLHGRAEQRSEILAHISREKCAVEDHQDGEGEILYRKRQREDVEMGGGPRHQRKQDVGQEQ